MISKSEAIQIVKEGLPGCEIRKVVEYENLYLFQVSRDQEFEEEVGMHFSVHKETGLFRDFSILHDGDFDKITELFLKA